MGVPGKLPKIPWESTKWVEKTVVPEPSGKEPRKKAVSGTVRVEKAPKTERILDVFERSATTRKPVLLYFTMKVCDTCRTMENLVLRQKAVVDQAKGYHSIQLVGDFITRDLLKKYDVKKAPTIVLLDFQGRKLATVVGRKSPRHLASLLAKIRARNSQIVKKDSRSKES